MLDLNELATGQIPGVTSALGASLAEAAGVCLESQGHTQGVLLQVRGGSGNGYPLSWPAVTSQAVRAWGNLERTTEAGAVAVAMLLAERETGQSVVRQSHIGTGFDFWLGNASPEGLLESAVLEVSGIRQGNDGMVEARMREKLQQMRRSRSLTLPAYVIVVEFGRPLADVRRDVIN